MSAHSSCRRFISVNFILSTKSFHLNNRASKHKHPPAPAHPCFHMSHSHTHTHTHRFMTIANPQPGLIAVTADIARQRKVISSTVVWVNADKAWLSSPFVISPHCLQSSLLPLLVFNLLLFFLPHCVNAARIHTIHLHRSLALRVTVSLMYVYKILTGVSVTADRVLEQKGSMYSESWRYGIPGKTAMGRKRHVEKEGAYKSKNVNGSTSCGLNKCIIVREDYTSVPPHRQMKNVLWLGCVISVCTKWKTNSLEW